MVSKICLPPSSRNVVFAKKKYAHLEGLDLADDPEDNSTDEEIDLLIGVDYYWSLMQDEIRRGPEGPVAQESRLGWVLSGPVDADGVDRDDQVLLICG